MVNSHPLYRLSYREVFRLSLRSRNYFRYTRIDAKSSIGRASDTIAREGANESNQFLAPQRLSLVKT